MNKRKRDKFKQREYQHTWYLNHKQKQIDKNRFFAKKRRAEYQALKAVPCADCKNLFPTVCMDFDHLPGTTKLSDINAIMMKWSRAKVLAEIAKCEVVCSNCHRIRTAKRACSQAELG